MVNRERLVNEFLELVSLDSLSKAEKQVAEALKNKFIEMGIEVIEDDAGQKIGGNTGNLIATVRGNKDVPAILLMAHMDTVIPGIGKKAIIEGDIIKSDGTTVLGGDDFGGIVSILEAIRVIRERNIEHGDIQVAFTIAEEIGLLGAKNLDYSKINAKFGFVMDSGGKIGTVAVTAPSQTKIDVVIKGKAAHAGMEPEKGVNAIQIAAEAISQMTLGRIDEETTANVGIINGGRATNVVCDNVEVRAEARSRNIEKLQMQTEHMKECFIKAAEKFGGIAEIQASVAYPPFNIAKDAKIISFLEKGAKEAGVDLVLEATGGGSDTNIINGKGIEAVDISVGMDKVHSVEERININDIIKATEFLIGIIKSIEY